MKRRATSKLDYSINLGLAALAGLSGCVSLVFVVGTLLAGLVLDKLFGTSPLFTIFFILAGVPIALWLMIQIALRSAKKIEQRQWGKSATLTKINDLHSKEDNSFEDYQ